MSAARISFLLAVLLCVVPASAYRKSLAEFDSDIQALVGKLSTNEKIAQMVLFPAYYFISGGAVDEAAVNASLDTGFGSIFDFENIERDSLRALVQRFQELATARGTKIPLLIATDSVHGVGYVRNATVFPHECGMAATFNRELVRDMGIVTGREMRASGLVWTFGPILDLMVQPTWPRAYEQWGEDPYLASVMARDIVGGLQGFPPALNRSDHIAACMKHFIGYGNPRNGHDQSSSWIPTRYLHMYFVPAFRAAIQAGIASSMETYVDVNGVPVVSSSYLLKTLLRDILNFDGLLVTDEGEIEAMVTDHSITNDYVDGVRRVMEATTIDMGMEGDTPRLRDSLQALAARGAISPDRIDLSVARVLQLKKDLGLFTNPYPMPNPDSQFATLEHRQWATTAAEESIVLLKNTNNALPIARTDKLVVIGQACNSIRLLSGGWTSEWQGARSDAYFTGNPDAQTVLAALTAAGKGAAPQAFNVYSWRYLDFSNSTLFYNEAAQFDFNDNEMRDALAAIATASNVVVCVGENSYAEHLGNLNDLNLFPKLQSMLRDIITNKKEAKLTLVLVEGRPRVIAPELINGFDAVIDALLPGPYGGGAVARVLLGLVNPSGRLPFSYPQFVSDSLTPYWRTTVDRNNYQPQWPFAAGLSYTTFSYSSLSVSPTTLTQPTDWLTISVVVTNTGSMAGKHSVPVFVTQLYRTIAPEVRMLKAFNKTKSLAPGESDTLQFRVPVSALSFYGLEDEERWDNGLFNLTVGSTTSLSLRSQFTLQLATPDVLPTPPGPQSCALQSKGALAGVVLGCLAAGATIVALVWGYWAVRGSLSAARDAASKPKSVRL